MAFTTTRNGGAISEINVTPMADIMIVLLIIFMVFTTAIVREDALKLPQAEHSRSRSDDRGPLRVTLHGDLGVSVESRRLTAADDLGAELRRALDERPEAAQAVHLRADRDLPYERIDDVARVLREAGAGPIELVVVPAVLRGPRP